MLPETHPLIEAVTEPLADNAERRMAAHAFLEEKFDADHPGIADAKARLETAGQRKFPVLRMASLGVLTAIVFAVTAFSMASSLRYIAMMENHNFLEPWGKPTLPPGLTAEQRLLLGDSELSHLEQKRRLHLHAPEDPAYFAEYAEAHLSTYKNLPPDFLETASRIVPENAFFTYFAAGQTGSESFTKKTSSTPSPPQRIVDGVRLGAIPSEKEFDITDPAAFEEALELIGKAATQPEFETYTNPMIAARVRLVPSGTMAEFTQSLVYSYGASAAGIIHLRYVADLMSARAEQLSKSDREEEFLALATQRDAFVSHLGRNPDAFLIGEMIHLVAASATAKNFEAAADRLGLAEMAENYRKQSETFQQERDLRIIRSSKEEDPFPEERAAILSEMTFPMVARQVNDPPPVSDADFKPLRMAEHELLGGLGVLSVSLVIALGALVVFLFRFVATPMIRFPAKRMARVMGAGDWLWVACLGVAPPILFFLAVTRLTPLGGREYGASLSLFLFPGIQLITLLLGLLIAPGIVVRWRLAKRLAPFGLGDRYTIPIALAVLAMIAVWSLTALPFVERLVLGQYTVIALAAPPVLCVCLVLANALRGILGKPAARLAQCVTAVAVLPAYSIAILALCAITPLYSAGEKHWVARETMLRIVPDAPDLGAYEFKVAAQMRKEINAITGVE